MSTIHNPSNFQPENYEVVDYLDNHAPEYAFGMDVEDFKAELNAWKAEWLRYFPSGAQHKCAHCGNGTIRYVAVCLFQPENKFVAFGDICVDRLNFKNRDEFKAEQLRQKAAGSKERLRISRLVEAFLNANADVKAVVDCVQNDEAQKDNRFAQDVVKKLFKYGSLSPRQIEFLLASPAKHLEQKGEKIERNIPDWTTGVQTVTGKIVGTKSVENRFHYGSTLKAIIETKDGRKCFGTCATRFPENGVWFSFVADFIVSDKDPKFAFYSRPKKIVVEQGAVAA